MSLVLDALVLQRNTAKHVVYNHLQIMVDHRSAGKTAFQKCIWPNIVTHVSPPLALGRRRCHKVSQGINGATVIVARTFAQSASSNSESTRHSHFLMWCKIPPSKAPNELPLFSTHRQGRFLSCKFVTPSAPYAAYAGRRTP